MDRKSDEMSTELTLYRELLADIKVRVRQAQHKAVLAANAEMILMYWDIGRMIAVRQGREGWGAGVIPRLAADLKNELPEEKGFSERNLGYMIRFAREYGAPPVLQQSAAKLPQPAARTGSRSVLQLHKPSSKALILQPPAAKSENPSGQSFPMECLLGLPWFHHVILIQKIKDLPIRLRYAQQARQQGWIRETLGVQIENRAHNPSEEGLTK
jgi:predicted nuclease of restriction endonuclease-like (RecB) superfamily